jgi:diaminohydroxyphosphoribosylaminopyrimidine deaminase/5-amino-6-(5-phosphoribosylamino)uracil reductase
MQRAIDLAQKSIGLTEPNPRVGCVIVSTRGEVLGQGHTQRAGQAHAEIAALQDAQARGADVRGATMYVTLEPCSHQGRTGPCCDALIAAGIGRVVASIEDPNPLVAGQGFTRLRQAGITVEVGPGAAQASELNIGFFSRMLRKTPWVRMKAAASIDGKTALANGVSQWITSPDARADGHRWRARASCVLTGIGTVLQDQPRLDVRLVETARQPDLVVVDSALQTPLDAALFIGGRRLFIYCAHPEPSKRVALEQRGATVIDLAGRRSDGKSTGKVDLGAMLKDLAAREMNEVHLEAGHKLNGSFVREALVDELLLYLAPKLLGQGADIASFGPIDELDQAVALEILSTTMVGPDLRVLARLQGRGRFSTPTSQDAAQSS